MSKALGLIRGRSMYYMEIALLVAGVIVLVIGYRKNRRNVLLTAAVLLFLAGALGSFFDGFADGYDQARSQAQTSLLGKRR